MTPSNEEYRIMGSILIHIGRWNKHKDSRGQRYTELKAIRRNLEALIAEHKHDPRAI